MAEYQLTPTQSESLRTVSDVRGETESDDGVAEVLDAGECYWCDEYSGEYPGRHASSAHPDKWAEFKGGSK
jgi:hypothetical protein